MCRPTLFSFKSVFFPFLSFPYDGPSVKAWPFKKSEQCAALLKDFLLEGNPCFETDDDEHDDFFSKLLKLCLGVERDMYVITLTFKCQYLFPLYVYTHIFISTSTQLCY